MRRVRFWMLAGTACLLATSWCAATAEDKPAQDKPAAEKPADAKPADAADPKADSKSDDDALFKVPEAGVKELQEFIDKIRIARYTGRVQAEAIAFQKKKLAALADATEKLLKLEISDETRIAMIRERGAALSGLIRYGDATAKTALADFLKELAEDKREAVVAEGKLLSLKSRLTNIPVKPDEQKQLVKELDDFLAHAKIDQTHVSMAFSLCINLEYLNADLAAEANETFAAHFEGNADPKIAARGKGMQAAAGRLRLVGKPLTLTGNTLDGKEFDWPSYKGKVVLVDFWASWCGPCVAELPNVLEQYAAYHDQGFDVVGINMDGTPEKAEAFIKSKKLPWANLYSKDEKLRSWNDPTATQFGISSIPATFLVDQEGKVVAMNVRGPALNTWLVKLLGVSKGVKSSATIAGDKPETLKPGSIKPATTAPGTPGKPETIKPATIKPAGDEKPGTIKPAATKPTDGKPEPVKPAGEKTPGKSPEAKPGDVKPPETKPAEPKAAEAKPAEVEKVDE